MIEYNLRIRSKKFSKIYYNYLLLNSIITLIFPIFNIIIIFKIETKINLSHDYYLLIDIIE